MNKFVDITGQTFGGRTVTGLSHQNPKSRNYYWYATCNGCGRKDVVSGTNLRKKVGCRRCVGKISGRKGLNSQSRGVPVYFIRCLDYIKVEYLVSETRKYTPDFTLPNGIIVETKGRFTTYDRKKHLLIQKQHPDLDIRFVFSNPNSKLYKGSKSTYASWCEKNNFIYAKKLIPKEWISE